MLQRACQAMKAMKAMKATQDAAFADSRFVLCAHDQQNLLCCLGPAKGRHRASPRTPPHMLFTACFVGLWFIGFAGDEEGRRRRGGACNEEHEGDEGLIGKQGRLSLQDS